MTHDALDPNNVLCVEVRIRQADEHHDDEEVRDDRIGNDEQHETKLGSLENAFRMLHQT